MKRFDVITIFPELIQIFVGQSLVARAIKKKLLAVKAHQLRDWTTDNHKTVDGRPYGGGAGMVMMVEPIAKAISTLKKSKNKNQKTRVILLSAKGKQFTQKDAHRLLKYDQLIFICGRYEGVDERVADVIADEEICTGPYVLFGGEIPTMTIMEAVARLVPGVIQKQESIQDESHAIVGVLEYPHYTRPEIFEYKDKSTKTRKLGVPHVLLSGDHVNIKAWRDKHRM